MMLTVQKILRSERLAHLTWMRIYSRHQLITRFYTFTPNFGVNCG